MWTKADEKLLRQLRIERGDPPAPLPRFQVVVSEIEGEYQVIDRHRQYRASFDFGPDWPDPREAAERWADRLNAEHARASTEDDHA